MRIEDLTRESCALHCTHKKTLKAILELVQSPYIIPFAALVFCFCFQTQGFCADSPTEMDTLTGNVMSTIFSPWLRKAALTFAGGLGLFQSYMAGSIRPLLSWGGLGLVVNYIPKLIDVITRVGG